jgi:hypothetical protein
MILLFTGVFFTTVFLDRQFAVRGRLTTGFFAREIDSMYQKKPSVSRL